MSKLLDKIIEAKSIMGDKAAEIIAEGYPLEEWDERRMVAKSIFNKHDNTPSMAWNKKDLYFKDFSTGKTFGIIDYYMYKYNENYIKAVKRLLDETKVSYSPSLFAYSDDSKTDFFKNYLYPKEETRKITGVAEEYLKKRGISDATMQYVDLRCDSNNNIAFQLRDCNGKILAVKYRPSHKLRQGEPKMFWQKNASNCPSLYNMDKCDITKPLLVTEGFCFTGDAEVLTPNGWVKLCDYNDELVMQVNQDGSSQFVMPIAKIKHEYTGKMVEVDRGGNYYSLTTPDHRLVYNTKDGFKKKAVQDFADGSYTIPTCANYIGGSGINLSDDEIRLFVAYSADGSLNKESCYAKKNVQRIRFVFSKERKFLRLKNILDNIGIQYTETVATDTKYKSNMSYYIGFTDEKSFLRKDFDWSWLYNMTVHQRKILLEEVQYWDGGQIKTRNMSEYYSVNKNNIDFVQAMCHISGFMSTIKHRKINYENCTVSMLFGKDHISWQKMWTSGQAKYIDYSGMVYCLQVPSGMLLVRQNEKISVSGNCDALACIEAGYTNVVSIPGGAEDDNWIQFNYDWLECFDEIILWFDNDNAGQQGLNKVVARLGEYRCKIAKPTEDHENAVEAYYQTYGAEGIRKTDANNVLLASGANAVLSIINSAEYPPAKNLKFLMDCSPVNISDIEKCSTGLGALDGVLYGNLFPCFTIYSGYAGSGKSSLANVATVISAIESGHKVFVFSGELSEGQLLDWIMSPLCGPNHIKEIKSKDYQRAFYYPTQQAEERVKRFYHDNIILYSSSDELDTSGEGIMNAMTMAYKRYGCDVFLIDNLMCISFENTGEDSKWDSQKKFIIKLMNFTNQYNVCTNLVLHPKKPSPGQNTVASVYDLHGASEIGNLCHRLIWVSRGASTGNDIIGKVKIDVVKDRPSQAAGSQCEIFYDKRTRRLFSNEEELYKEYSWEKAGSLIQYRPEDASKLLCNLAKVQIPYTEEEPY